MCACKHRTKLPLACSLSSSSVSSTPGKQLQTIRHFLSSESPPSRASPEYDDADESVGKLAANIMIEDARWLDQHQEELDRPDLSLGRTCVSSESVLSDSTDDTVSIGNATASPPVRGDAFESSTRSMLVRAKQGAKHKAKVTSYRHAKTLKGFGSLIGQPEMEKGRRGNFQPSHLQ